MEQSELIKEAVKEEYGKRALNYKVQEKSVSCGSSCVSIDDYKIVGNEYTKMEGYNPDADIGAGCGLPTKFANIKSGDTVVDLGSGAGNDCFIARQIVGESGKVIGIDMTEEMVKRARANSEKLSFKNMEFILGEIENIPLASNTADVVVSNCVLNLVPDKKKAFSEIYRILKPGAHFSISDIVFIGTMPDIIKNSKISYVKCIAGAITKDSYLGIIQELGFTAMVLQKEEKLTMPEEFVKNYLNEEEYNVLKKSDMKVFSISVYAEKPKDN